VYKSVYISSHVLTCIQTYICICLDMYGNLYVYVLTCMETYICICVDMYRDPHMSRFSFDMYSDRYTYTETYIVF